MTHSEAYVSALPASVSRSLLNGEGPRIELLRCLPAGKSALTLKRPPLLFVHGAFAGGWCWAQHFLPYFADRGWPAYALSLRGHAGSEGADSLHQWGLADYVQDLSCAVDALGAPAILIGHSMGGFVVQKYLEQGVGLGAVLMASLPPGGMMETALHMMMNDPAMLWRLGGILCFGADVGAGVDMRRILFSDDMENKDLARYGRLLQGESSRAAFELSQPLFWPALRMRGLPSLVMGAENDAFLSSASLVRTAMFHGADMEILPNIAHAMMLDRRWQTAAERLDNWLVPRFS